MFRAFCALLLLTALAGAQSVETQLLTVNVDLVDVYFTVCNQHGRLVGNLGQNDFVIYEDGDRQVITHFSFETEEPLTIAVLIDTSGSVRYKLPFEQEAAIRFLDSTLRRGRDQAAVFSFDSTIDLRQDFTDSPELLSAAVKRTVAGGGTRLHDALSLLVNSTFTGSEGRRAILLLTDGADNSSKITAEAVIEAAQRNNVAIYAVSVNSIGPDFGDFEGNDDVLNAFGMETGGKVFYPKKVKDLSADLAAISRELRSQYSIAYRSTNPKRDGTYRSIRIETKNGLNVRARPGYFAPSLISAATR